MASYTADQLYGSGTYAEALSGTLTFTFNNPSTGAAYFILESITDNEGNYISNDVAKGIYSLDSGLEGLVTSSFVAGVVVKPGVHSMVMEADASTPISGSILRTTGGISLTIS
jgi:hypothetical protein